MLYTVKQWKICETKLIQTCKQQKRLFKIDIKNKLFVT